MAQVTGIIIHNFAPGFNKDKTSCRIPFCEKDAAIGIVPYIQSGEAISKRLAGISAKQLLSGLLNNIYRIIITTEPCNIPGILSFPYLDEHLYAALPPEHPLAQRAELSLHDLNGENALILSNIGFWEEICKQKMPDSLFFVQNDAVTLHELRKSSVLVAFSTDLTIEMAKEMPKEKEGRCYVPLMDPEVNVTYYCNIKETDRDFFASLISYLSPL